ncbi:hypothetical protein KM043_006632 [Ampulex compressa]|nr:hypothetical protein KM043_006632 [Ampulex compressa]
MLLEAAINAARYTNKNPRQFPSKARTKRSVGFLRDARRESDVLRISERSRGETCGVTREESSGPSFPALPLPSCLATSMALGRQKGGKKVRAMEGKKKKREEEEEEERAGGLACKKGKYCFAAKTGAHILKWKGGPWRGGCRAVLRELRKNSTDPSGGLPNCGRSFGADGLRKTKGTTVALSSD